MPTIKLVVFDENADFRLSLEHYSQSLPGVEYTGVASDVSGELKRSAESEPDIIFYASELVQGLGASQFQEMRSVWPNALCYRLTVFDESVYDEFASGKGFDGSVPRAQIEDYLPKIVERLKETE